LVTIQGLGCEIGEMFSIIFKTNLFTQAMVLTLSSIEAPLSPLQLVAFENIVGNESFAHNKQ